jgi:hypothetical protein
MLQYRTNCTGRVILKGHKKIEEKTLAELSEIRSTVLLSIPKKANPLTFD